MPLKVSSKHLHPALALFLVWLLLLSPPAGAYSVLSHEEVVDMAWTQQIVPLLRARYPGISDADIKTAHAYAYGGSVIQDIGYYPFGNKYFSDLLHYVRTGDFVTALIRDSSNANEYAFALGALAHYCGDVLGHPYVNQVTADEYPKLRRRYGSIVTYDQDPVAHLRTEFGFDVVEVAHGAYSQDNYRDFIGFQVAKPLLERAFLETYGIPMDHIMKHEDLAIGTYRYAVAGLIPKMTKVALVSYHDQIEKANPSFDKRKFVYRLNHTEFVKQYGKTYTRPGPGSRILAFVLQVVPKVGPFRALRVMIPNASEQDLYLKSVNSTVDRYKVYLSQVSAPAMPAPEDLSAAPDVASAATPSPDPLVASKLGVLSSNAVNEPTSPTLSAIDLDTGKPTHSGEYRLADETYAKLLDQLIIDNKTQPPDDLRANILAFYEHSSAPNPGNHKPEDWQKVQSELATLKTSGLKVVPAIQPAATPSTVH